MGSDFNIEFLWGESLTADISWSVKRGEKDRRPPTDDGRKKDRWRTTDDRRYSKTINSRPKFA